MYVCCDCGQSGVLVFDVYGGYLLSGCMVCSSMQLLIVVIWKWLSILMLSSGVLSFGMIVIVVCGIENGLICIILLVVRVFCVCFVVVLKFDILFVWMLVFVVMWFGMLVNFVFVLIMNKMGNLFMLLVMQKWLLLVCGMVQFLLCCCWGF